MKRKHTGRTRRFGDLSLSQKMTILVLLVVIVLLIVFFCVFRIMVSDLQEYMINNNQQLLSLIHIELNDQIQSMQHAATQIMGNNYVKRYVSDPSSYHESSLRSIITRHGLVSFGIGTSEASDLLSVYDLFSLSNVSGFLIVADHETPHYISHGNVPDNETCKNLIEQIKAHTNTDQNTSTLSLSREMYKAIDGLCYVVPIAGTSGSTTVDMTPHGYLIIFSGSYHLQKILAKYYREDVTIVISDYKGKTIWSSSDEYMDIEMDNKGLSGIQTEIFDGAEKMVVYNNLSSVKWTVSLHAPLKAVTDQMQNYWYMFFLTVISVLVMYLLLISFFSQSVTSRLNEIISVITNIRSGNMESRFPVVYHDEISQIGEEFNSMIDQLQKYHINVATAQLRQKEAELHALQSQINPHFLYNSLDCIRSTALVNHDITAARQTQTLANMFRYTVSGNISMENVTIRAEIDHIYDYLSMLSFRFEDRYFVDLRISDEILPLQTLKLVMQPVVENAFTHGVRHMASGGSVLISGRLDEQKKCVIFCVEDNGQGIEPERLAYLHKLLRTSPSSQSDVPFMGLVNINDRIHLAYGNHYGVEVESSPGRGTKVTVRIPAIAQEGGPADAKGNVD